MKRVFLTVVLSACSLLMYMFALAHQNRLMTHTVSIKDCSSKTLNVFFISDIHRRRLPKQLINQLRHSAIHAVIVGGDVAEQGVPLERVKRNMQMLASVGPLYYIFGNNDQEVGTELLMKIVEEVGGVTLIDQTVTIPQHPTWGLCGLQDPTNGPVDIDQAVTSAERCEHTILAVHNPSQFRKIASRLQPKLMLAGHTHGGQIRLGTWGLQDKGKFQTTETGAQLISNGYGTTMVPLRLGAKSECHIVEIHY
ncbi:metallophosphoesterase family protein [Sporosarcina sp. GW1-11]|uniref:metallophosphoesterase n=1 Tax=Sporosarcina sp. GW1-11 TaxID=2899126 RepID=UPI00294C0AB0|nr:metallophosphoesterase family protein [Sporosarcina sp. GW1-11]MDV6377655.1 metallophosphoesterase family protein [Sporosarcina sp. GW1-11]